MEVYGVLVQVRYVLACICVDWCVCDKGTFVDVVVDKCGGHALPVVHKRSRVS